MPCRCAVCICAPCCLACRSSDSLNWSIFPCVLNQSTDPAVSIFFQDTYFFTNRSAYFFESCRMPIFLRFSICDIHVGEWYACPVFCPVSRRFFHREHRRVPGGQPGGRAPARWPGASREGGQVGSPEQQDPVALADFACSLDPAAWHVVFIFSFESALLEFFQLGWFIWHFCIRGISHVCASLLFYRCLV